MDLSSLPRPRVVTAVLIVVQSVLMPFAIAWIFAVLVAPAGGPPSLKGRASIGGQDVVVRERTQLGRGSAWFTFGRHALRNPESLDLPEVRVPGWIRSFIVPLPDPEYGDTTTLTREIFTFGWPLRFTWYESVRYLQRVDENAEFRPIFDGRVLDMAEFDLPDLASVNGGKRVLPLHIWWGPLIGNILFFLLLFGGIWFGWAMLRGGASGRAALRGSIAGRGALSARGSR